ncbi:MAG: glucoamylase family protein [Candidatus Firestonebacteria bacterium]
MEITTENIRKNIAWLKAKVISDELIVKYHDELPLREEIFSVEQLELHAKKIAETHEIAVEPGEDKLLKRLDENEAILVDVYDILSSTLEKKLKIVPAAEWLIDNFYLIEEQVRIAKKHFPKNFSKELPRLKNGLFEGYPRVYCLALELISHSDGRLHRNSLNRYISAYQSKINLSLGELWAIPIMLRLSLIENLRRVGVRIYIGRKDRDLAASWAERLIKKAVESPKDVIVEMAEMAKASLPMTSAFVSELVRRIQGQNIALALSLTWLQQRVEEQGLTMEKLVMLEGQQQAMDQVSVGNSINSLRLLNSLDWNEFVESMSSVHSVLSKDPSGIYDKMNFDTRDMYRHVIERLARKSSFSEKEIAAKCVELAAEKTEAGEKHKYCHVGYFLIDEGIYELEKQAAYRRSAKDIITRLLKKRPFFFYAGSIGAVTLLISFAVISFLLYCDSPLGHIAVAGVLILFCSGNLGGSLVNWLITVFVKPKVLPKLDFSAGIPDEFRTVVAVPTMIFSKKNIEALLEKMEIEYFSNKDKNIYFALLTDFSDALSRETEGDNELLFHVKNGIEELNKKYQEERKSIFFLMHRFRKWNESEKAWMGYERKRGKLAEFNDLIRGREKPGSDNIVVGERDILKTVKYVVTLDTDTHAPLDSVRKMAAAIAHPLNAAVIDKEKGKVTEGYGILQPRLGITIESLNASMFAKIFGGETGIDPYSRAVSDVYQDVFSEGSFFGKGIYDVEVFSEVTDGVFPENLVLSHDLIESCYLRSGIMSDVVLYEKYPSELVEDAYRRHRWIRGDWQISRWLFENVLDEKKAKKKNPLSFLNQWKIFDNLRRSLIPAAMLILLILGWTVFAHPFFWSIFVVLVVLIPTILSITMDILKKPEDMSFKSYMNSIISSITTRLAQAGISLIVLPYEAYYSVHAVITANFRKHISHKKLLEWKPAGMLALEFNENLPGVMASMWFAPVISLLLVVFMLSYSYMTLLSSWVLLGFWFASPFFTWSISRPSAEHKVFLGRRQIQYLRALARKIWRYYEVFAGEEDNWIPPDNYQEGAVERIAHRTSPTNIGLYFLSCAASREFKYMPSSQFLTRIENAFATLAKMERFRGHFYNWYDTKTLEVLPPRYISTVDSGNFIGHLIVLESALKETQKIHVVSKETLKGLADVFVLVGKAAVQTPKKEKEKAGIAEIIQRIEAEVKEEVAGLSGFLSKILRIKDHADKVLVLANNLKNKDAGEWAKALVDQGSAVLSELKGFAPWTGSKEYERLILNENKLEGAEEFDSIKKIMKGFETYIPTIGDISKLYVETDVLFKALEKRVKNDGIINLQRMIEQGAENAAGILKRAEKLAAECASLSEADYAFLYDKFRRLFYIGYNDGVKKYDNGYYDLLASESRMFSYIAVAKSLVPQEHWFALGRLLTTFSGEPALLSWGGSMFEYLMPLIVMPSHKDTLLDKTYKTVVDRQIKYCAQKGVVWGISESGYNTVDSQFNYQYSSFGIPGLGFRPRLSEELVIAPYASMLALMVYPDKACLNLQEMSKTGMEGKYGMYEAVDFTEVRITGEEKRKIITSYMSHHQGMSFIALSNVIHNNSMQRRFMENIAMRSASILLEEKIPRIIPFYPQYSPGGTLQRSGADVPLVRTFTDPNLPAPEVHLLSNGRIHVMITNSGGGYIKWKDIAVTRWRVDSTLDNWGPFVYIKDVEKNEFWSMGYQPALKEPDRYEVSFLQARAEFKRMDNSIGINAEISVSPEDDIELKRIRITNYGWTSRQVEITTYGEVSLRDQIADELHPCFGNMFVQTEILKDRNSIICTRRSGSKSEKPPFLFHVMSVHGKNPEGYSFETDREKFIGRNRSVRNPAMMEDAGRLSNTEGDVLDPVISSRCMLRVEPDQTVLVDIVTGVAETKNAALSLIDKYKDRSLADRVFALAWTHAQVLLQQLNATEIDAQMYGRLAGAIIFSNQLWRANSAVMLKNTRGQSDLWGYGISGELPIVLLKMSDMSNTDIVIQLLKAHAYWRMKGLSVDLVIWNEDHSSYRQQLQDQIMGIITTGTESHLVDRPGGIFVRRTDQMSEEDKILMQSVAKIVISDFGGLLSEQIKRAKLPPSAVPLLKTVKIRAGDRSKTLNPDKNELIYFNEFGGFGKEGKEYVIILNPGESTPVPWSNVIANERIGTILSEAGGAYTWLENSHEFRITPWLNDPVEDKSGEAVYIRDEETGRFWSPSPFPARGKNTYVCRHGLGYSVFEYLESSIQTEMTVFVSAEDPVKYTIVKIKNTGKTKRNISVTLYYDLVLGSLERKNDMHIITEMDHHSGALMARNPYNTEFPGYTVFMNVNEARRSFTGDKTEFIGRNRSIADPQAMKNSKLSGRVGVGFDPCFALQVQFSLVEGQEREIVFTTGGNKSAYITGETIKRHSGTIKANEELIKVRKYWDRICGAIKIETPDNEINILANGWLIYQTLSSRFFARAGYYQSGGAFGFRDQLQDCLAIMYSEPEIVRQHIIRCAAHQFRQGDVLHWWHEPFGRGVRTRCSDDMLWLVFVLWRYVEVTGDTGILDEKVNYMEGRVLNSDEESYYDKPVRSEESGSIYEHCLRALKKASAYGEHGLPLMGSGDWNDGMNLVGHEGKGESVWLAFFLYCTLNSAVKMAEIKNDKTSAEAMKKEAEILRQNIEKNGWDGEWYIRAFYDSGKPLGSKTDAECAIDSIAQSWSVISGAADPQRARNAMESVDSLLVDRKNKIIKIFTPPFDVSEDEPGYIKGYIPGIRENGGQYTHAAIWVIIAYAIMGDKDKAWELLNMINPINHAKNRTGAVKYKSEPYVVAADVYSNKKRAGQGGWTWYTGSAGWMYRLIMEYLIGIKIQGNRISLNPSCLKTGWKFVKIGYRYKKSTYNFEVQITGQERKILNCKVDKILCEDNVIDMIDDGKEHIVDITVG